MGHLEDQAEILEHLSECPPDEACELLAAVSCSLQAMLDDEEEQSDELRQSLSIIADELRRIGPLSGASAA